MSTVVDLAIIGAGVVGCAIAREFARYDLSVVVLEASDDVSDGTSKANTAILHTGFDAKPGTLEAALVRRGYELLGDYAAAAGIPVEPLGALLVAWDDVQLAALGPIEATARENGYLDARTVDVDELYRREPHLGPGALGALEIPGESIICPWTTPLAFATEAVRLGARLRSGCRVTSVNTTKADGRTALGCDDGSSVSAAWVVNAGGLHSDSIDRLFGHERFAVTPRRGQLIVFDKLARSLVNHILLPVPTAMGKGVLVAPTVFGNVMLGPTAEDLDDKDDTSSTVEGIELLMSKGKVLMPALLDEEVTAVYAGLRAATEHTDYQIHVDADRRYVCVGGIRSTGLTSALAIAEHVRGLAADAGMALTEVRQAAPPRMPNLGEAGLRPYQDAQRIAADPRYGRIMCHCERVTEGEISDAVASDVPARSWDGLRRRTRAMNGRCQGFYCSAEIRNRFELAGSGDKDGRS